MGTHNNSSEELSMKQLRLDTDRSGNGVLTSDAQSRVRSSSRTFFDLSVDDVNSPTDLNAATGYPY
jgi:hypothetical protein